MPNKIFHVSGKIIDRRTGEGLAGLRVEAWDKDYKVADQARL